MFRKPERFPRSRPRRARSLRASRPIIEQLEKRLLLVANTFGEIRGTAFQDVTGDGLTADDTRLNGVVISLYRDGGDLTFNGGGVDDTFIRNETTSGTGTYAFDGLGEGTYFVQQPTPGGLVQRPGDDVVTVTISAADALGVPGMVIDDFTSPPAPGQTVTASSTGSLTDDSAVTATGVAGGERDLFVELTSANGQIQLEANAFGLDLLEFSASATGQGTRRITYDGSDGDATTLDPTGLAGVDLTDGQSLSGILFQIGADQTNGVMEVRLHSSAADSSTASVAIPNTGGVGSERIFIPFSDFVVLSGAGASPTNIGSSGKSGLLVAKSGHADFTEGVTTPSSERRNQHVHQSFVPCVRDSGLPVSGHKVS